MSAESLTSLGVGVVGPFVKFPAELPRFPSKTSGAGRWEERSLQQRAY